MPKHKTPLIKRLAEARTLRKNRSERVRKKSPIKKLAEARKLRKNRLERAGAELSSAQGFKSNFPGATAEKRAPEIRSGIHILRVKKPIPVTFKDVAKMRTRTVPLVKDVRKAVSKIRAAQQKLKEAKAEAGYPSSNAEISKIRSQPKFYSQEEIEHTAQVLKEATERAEANARKAAARKAEEKSPKFRERVRGVRDNLKKRIPGRKKRKGR